MGLELTTPRSRVACSNDSQPGTPERSLYTLKSHLFPPGVADVEKVEEKSAVDLTPIVVEDKGECLEKLIVTKKDSKTRCKDFISGTPPGFSHPYNYLIPS